MSIFINWAFISIDISLTHDMIHPHQIFGFQQNSDKITNRVESIWVNRQEEVGSPG